MTLLPWQQQEWDALTRARDQLPHALLLHGPAGIGKKRFALALAKWLLCAAPRTSGACGECSACRWFEQGGHPDFRLIEPDTETQETEGEGKNKKPGRYITIKEIRALGDFLGLAAHQGGWRVIVLHPAESMNLAAANALLKTLEEPPLRVMLVLIAHQPGRLLPTVLSRCRKLSLGLPDPEEAMLWLNGEGMALPEPLLREAGGAPLLALEYAEPERQARRRRFVERLGRPGQPALFDLAQEYSQHLPEAWGWLVRWLYDLLALKANAEPRFFPGEADILSRLAARMSVNRLWSLQDELRAAKRGLHHPLNAQLLLESWLLRYAELEEADRG